MGYELKPSQVDELKAIHHELVELHKRVVIVMHENRTGDHTWDTLLDARLNISEAMSDILSVI